MEIPPIDGWEFRVEEHNVVGIYERKTGKRVGEVTMYDDSSAFARNSWRWRFKIEGGNSASGYMPKPPA